MKTWLRNVLGINQQSAARSDRLNTFEKRQSAFDARVTEWNTQLKFLQRRLSLLEAGIEPSPTTKPFTPKLREESDGFWFGPWKVVSWSITHITESRRQIPARHMPTLRGYFDAGWNVILSFCPEGPYYPTATINAENVRGDVEVTADMFEEETK